jgi:hypothetical protein
MGVRGRRPCFGDQNPLLERCAEPKSAFTIAQLFSLVIRIGIYVRFIGRIMIIG